LVIYIKQHIVCTPSLTFKRTSRTHVWGWTWICYVLQQLAFVNVKPQTRSQNFVLCRLWHSSCRVAWRFGFLRLRRKSARTSVTAGCFLQLLPLRMQKASVVSL